MSKDSLNREEYINSAGTRVSEENIDRTRRVTFSGVASMITGLFGLSTKTTASTGVSSGQRVTDISPSGVRDVLEHHEWVIETLAQVDLLEAQTASGLVGSRTASDDPAKQTFAQASEKIETMVEKPDQNVVELEVHGPKGIVGLTLDKEGLYTAIDTPDSIDDDEILENVHQESNKVSVPTLQDTVSTASSCQDGYKPANQIDHPFNDCYINNNYDGGSGCMRVAKAEAFKDFGWGSICQASSCYCNNNCPNGVCNTCESTMVSINHPDYNDTGWLTYVYGCCPQQCYGTCAGKCICSGSATACDGAA